MCVSQSSKVKIEQKSRTSAHHHINTAILLITHVVGFLARHNMCSGTNHIVTCLTHPKHPLHNLYIIFDSLWFGDCFIDCESIRRYWKENF